MQSECTNQSDNGHQLYVKNELQKAQGSLSRIFKDQNIKKKLDLQLFLHFQRMLPISRYHYDEGQESQFYDKIVSKQQVVNETIKYLNYFKENINPFPPQHNQQLLFLIDIYNKSNELITNGYCIELYYQDLIDPGRFMLNFWTIKQRIDLKPFTSFNNWNHLVFLSFSSCGWLNDDDWGTLVEHAGSSFNNLKGLNLWGNKISVIKEKDIGQFKSLQQIGLKNNPLNEQSIEVLERLKLQCNAMTIQFDNDFQ